MFDKLTRTWRAFRSAAPGERFVSAQRRRRRSGSSTWLRVLSIGGGILLIAAGLVALVMPGPGVLLLLFGAGLIARESAVVARWMDRVELAVRATLRWCRRVWKAAPWLVKALLLALGAGLAFAAGWGAWLYIDSR